MDASARVVSFSNDDRHTHTDQSVTLARLVASAETTFFEACIGSQEYRRAAATMAFAEPVFAAAEPASLLGALLKLRYCHRHLRALAGAIDGASIAQTAPALLAAARKLARKDPEAVPSVCAAAAACRAALAGPNRWVDAGHRSMLSLHLETVVGALPRLSRPAARRAH